MESVAAQEVSEEKTVNLEGKGERAYQASADDGVLLEHGAHGTQEDDAGALASCHS